MHAGIRPPLHWETLFDSLRQKREREFWRASDSARSLVIFLLSLFFSVGTPPSSGSYTTKKESPAGWFGPADIESSPWWSWSDPSSPSQASRNIVKESWVHSLLCKSAGREARAIQYLDNIPSSSSSSTSFAPLEKKKKLSFFSRSGCCFFQVKVFVIFWRLIIFSLSFLCVLQKNVSAPLQSWLQSCRPCRKFRLLFVCFSCYVGGERILAVSHSCVARLFRFHSISFFSFSSSFFFRERDTTEAVVFPREDAGRSRVSCVCVCAKPGVLIEYRRLPCLFLATSRNPFSFSLPLLMFWFLLALKTGRERKELLFGWLAPQLSTQFDRLDRIRHFTSTMIAVQPLSAGTEKISLSLGRCNQLLFDSPFIAAWRGGQKKEVSVSRFRVRFGTSRKEGSLW